MQAILWRHRRGVLDLTRRGVVMGVLNVTPDSFSDGGHYLDPKVAAAQAMKMVEEGAEIIDVGGESTRPGAEPVSPEEEIRRVVPAIQAIRTRSQVVISIDTFKASVAEQALRAGADIINDITALRGDPAMPQVALASQAGVVLMHMQGTPRTMQNAPTYRDAPAEVGDFLRQRLAWAINCGMVEEAIALDPGIGFGKTPEHNRDLLLSTREFTSTTRPILIGVSRKSFLRWVAEAPALSERFWPGVALTSFCREEGARVFRVHEPLAHTHALRMTEAILGGPQPEATLAHA